MRTGRVTLLAGSTRPLIVMLFVAVQQAITLQAAAAQSSTEHLAAPWLAPAGIQFPYEGLHNSLQQLVATQAGGSGRIAVTFFTAAHQPMLLNHVYSMVKYGQVRNPTRRISGMGLAVVTLGKYITQAGSHKTS